MYCQVSRRQSIQRIPAYLPTEPPHQSASPGESLRTLSGDSKSTSSGHVTPRIVHVEGLRWRRQPQPPPPVNFNRHHDGIAPYLVRSNSSAGYNASVESPVHVGRKRSFSALKRQHHDGNYYLPRERLVPPSRPHAGQCPPLLPSRLEAQYRDSYDRQCPPVPYHQRRQYHLPNNRKNNRGSRNSLYLPSTGNAASWKGEFNSSAVPLRQPPGPSKWKSEVDLRVSNLDEESKQIYNEILDVIKLCDSPNQDTSVFESQPQANPDRRWHSLQEKCSSFQDLNVSDQLRDFTGKRTPMPALKLVDKKPEFVRHHSDRTATDLTASLRGLDLSARPLTPRSSSLSASKFSSGYHLDGLFVDNAEETALAALDEAIGADFTGSSANAGPATNDPIHFVSSYPDKTETNLTKQQERQRKGAASPTTQSVIEVEEERRGCDELDDATDCSDKEPVLFQLVGEPEAASSGLPCAPPDGDVPGHIRPFSPASRSDTSDID